MPVGLVEDARGRPPLERALGDAATHLRLDRGLARLTQRSLEGVVVVALD